MPRVSVVIPAYNSQQTLAATLFSVCQQTYTDWECILVDDGSTDATADIIDTYIKRDPRFRAVSQKQSGPALARNTGIALATGEFIATLDADDIALPQRLQKQVEYLNFHADIIACGSAIQLMDENSVLGGVKRYPSQPGLTAWSLLFFSSIIHPTLTVRHQYLERVGCYSNYYTLADDYRLLSKLVFEGSIVNMSEVLVQYRMWKHNLTTTKWAQQEETANSVLRQLLSRLGVTASDRIIASLRGLPRNKYPHDLSVMKETADTIMGVLSPALEIFGRTVADRRAICRDAGMRMLMLAALASRYDVSDSMRFAGQALRTSPESLIMFSYKAGRAVISSLMRSFRL